MTRKTTSTTIAVGAVVALLAACAAPKTRPSVSSDLLDQADRALAAGEIGKTISLLDGRVSDSIRGSRLLGLAYLQVRRYDRAREAFATVVRLDAADIESWLSMAAACEEDRFFDRAAECYKRVLELDPKHSAAAAKLALLLADLHRTPEAARALRTAAELNPEDLDIRYRLGVVELEREQYAAAASAFDLVLLRANDRAPSLLGRGLARALDARASGNHAAEALDAAADDLRRAGELAADDPAPIFNLGWLSEELRNDPKAAEAYYREALRRRADHLQSSVRLAVLLRNSGRAAEALQLFEKARAASADPRQVRDLDSQIAELKALGSSK